MMGYKTIYNGPITADNCPDCDDAREYGGGIRVGGRRYCQAHFPVLEKCEELDVCEDCLFCKECHEDCTHDMCQHGRHNNSLK